MRIATCTPVNFNADAHFFGRDSGLMCRGFQAAGHDCVVIMPGLSAAGDAPDLVRARPEDLRDSAWWRSRRLEMVLLYAWGDPIHLEVATAIRRAGILLIQNLDAAGIESPYADIHRWWRSLAGIIAGPQPVARKFRLAARGIRDLAPGIYERRRLRMMEEADFLGAVSPPAAQSIQQYAKALGFPGVAEKVLTIPHPVTMEMVWNGEAKANHVLCVGRWHAEDHHQKDPHTLLKVLATFLRQRPDWSAGIIGRGASQLGTSPTGASLALFGDRLSFTETLDRPTLRGHYAASRILLCPSRYESFHISSAEALCCGCSVVVAEHPLLASTAWFTTRDSGTLATSRKPADLLSALLTEASRWDSGHRSAQSISSAWAADLHASATAAHLIQSIHPV